MSLARLAEENKGNNCPQLLPPRRSSVNTRCFAVLSTPILGCFSQEKGPNFRFFELRVSIAERIGETEGPPTKFIERRGSRVESWTAADMLGRRRLASQRSQMVLSSSQAPGAQNTGSGAGSARCFPGVASLVFIFIRHFTKGGVTNLDTPPKKVEGI